MALEKANDNPVLEGLALAEIVSYTGPSTDPGPDYLTALPRPPGLAATDGDPVIVGDLDYSGFAPMDEHILDESKSRLRLLAPGSAEPSILGTVSSSEGDSISVDLQKQPNNTHLSAEKIVIYSDSIDGAVVSAINFSENVALVHNQEITGDAKNFHVENGTFTLFINCRVDNGDPNILVAGSQATTKIKFKDRRNRAGVTVKFTTTSGQVSPATAQTDASGNCETVYTASAQASTAKITASIDSGLAASVYVYNAEYDFLNLSNVAGLSGYNDTTFGHNPV